MQRIVVRVLMDISDKWCPSRIFTGAVLFKIFINDTDERIESILSIFADDTKPSGAVTTPERQDAIQKYLHKLEERTHGNLMRFNKTECKALDWSNPWLQHKLGMNRWRAGLGRRT